MRSSSRRVVAVAEQIASRWPASVEPAALDLAGFGADVVACDDGEPERGELERAGVEVHTGGTPVELLEGRKLLVVAPGLAEHHPLVRAALDGGVEVWSEVELAARLTDLPMVGVTGTNGKTTTAELAAAMVAASGRRVVAAGNVGLPLIDAVLARQPPDALVVELSSFQLRFTSTRPPRRGCGPTRGPGTGRCTRPTTRWWPRTLPTLRACRCRSGSAGCRSAAWGSRRGSRCRGSRATRARCGAPRRCACPGATTWPTPWPPPAWRWRSAPTRPP